MSQQDDDLLRQCDCHRCAAGRERLREWLCGTVAAIVVGVAAAVLWALLT